MLNHCLRFLFASWIAISAAAFMTVAHAGPLQVDLEAGDSNDKIRVSLTNSGAVPLTILRRDTPFESTLSSNVFRIERSTKKWPLLETADYVGREVKRASPKSSHFLLLQPGATVSTQLVLNEYYQIEATGAYTVNFDGEVALQMKRELHPLVTTPGSGSTRNHDLIRFFHSIRLLDRC